MFPLVLYASFFSSEDQLSKLEKKEQMEMAVGFLLYRKRQERTELKGLKRVAGSFDD